MSKLFNKKGFTLIELMIVVVIIGILAAIAIPNFLRYQLKSKFSEGANNIGGIRTNEEAFHAKWDYYVGAKPTPNATPGTAKQSWIQTTGFGTMGYSPAGNVYFSYAVGGAAAAPANDAAILGYATDTTFNAGAIANPLNVPTSQLWIGAVSNLDGDANKAAEYQGLANTDIVPIGSAAGISGENVF